MSKLKIYIIVIILFVLFIFILFILKNQQKGVGSVTVDKHTLVFYVDYNKNSAVLGFWEKVKNRRRYFPIYCSTSPRILSVKLKVLFSESKKEICIISNWKGYKKLAFYRLGSNICLTKYGENNFYDTPFPKSIGGGKKNNFPNDQELAKMKELAIITINN